jgi:hypothetical protein
MSHRDVNTRLHVGLSLVNNPRTFQSARLHCPKEQLMVIVDHLAHRVFEEGWSLGLAEPVGDRLWMIDVPTRQVVAAVACSLLGDRIQSVRQSQSRHSVQLHNLSMGSTFAPR